MSSLKLKLLAALVVGAFSAISVANAAAPEERWVPGRLLVQPKAGLSDAEFAKVLQGHGAKSVGKIKGIGVHIVQLPANASEKAVAALLAHNPHVKFAERDMLVQANATANDPYFPNAWHLTKTGVTSAWDSVTGQGMTVAVLDTGVDSNHPELAGQLVAGWNFYDNNSNTADVYGHGTMVAGTVAALTNNAIGVASVAPNAKVMPIRVADATGTGSWSAMASGITWAADQGVQVANMSYAPVSGSSTIQSAGQYLKNKGGLLVVSSGNYGTQNAAGKTDTMIVVSATDSNDVVASWSSFGNDVDVSAPGVGIYTLKMAGAYCNCQGTSFSSPVTAAIIALMKQANPTLGPADLERVLFSTAKDLGTAGWDMYYGYGRVDAAAAVAAAKVAVVSDTTAPTVAIANPLAGTTVKGVVPVSVSASDNQGVTRVDLAINGVNLASDISTPYSFSWDSTQVFDGNVTLTATAYDAAGNYKAQSVSLIVQNTVDTIVPVAKISNPGNSAKVAGTVSVSASATDNISVSKVNLYIDGKLVSSASGNSLTYSWNTRKVTAGSHVLKVEGVDVSGNVGVAEVSVTK